MYVAVLNTQKSVLQEDAEKLRKELHDGNFLWKLLDELKKLDALGSHIMPAVTQQLISKVLVLLKAGWPSVIKMFRKHFTNKRLSKIVNYFRLTLEMCFVFFFHACFSACSAALVATASLRQTCFSGNELNSSSKAPNHD